MKKLKIEMSLQDVCYKPTKKLKHVHGQRVVSGVVTVKNEYNEDRAQLFIPTDAKDQYTTPLLKTCLRGCKSLVKKAHSWLM